MQRNLYLAFICAVFFVSSAMAQSGSGTLKGKITDKKTGEVLPFVNVVVQQGDRQISGSASDINGVYTIKPLTPGSYNVVVSFVGYQKAQVNGVTINSDQITFLDFALNPTAVQMKEVQVTTYKTPLIEKDGGPEKTTVTRQEIDKMAARSATAIAATTAGTQSDANGNISIRGARTSNTYYYIDGVKIQGTPSLPKDAIQEVSVMTGGIPASYGDATGGIINITTRGATDKWFGGIDALTSGYKNQNGKGIGLDPYSRSQYEGYLSGPILFSKPDSLNHTRPILGFFLAANYTNDMDPRPSAIGNYRLKSDAAQRLVENPATYTVNGTSTPSSGNAYILDGQVFPVDNLVTPQIRGIYNSDFIRSSDVEKVSAEQNARFQRVTGSGKLDFNPTKDITVTLGANFDYSKQRNYSYSQSLMDYNNNASRHDLTYRGYVKFTQRFPNSKDNKDKGGLKNVFYSAMLDLTHRSTTIEDALHKQNYFDYGYIGKFDVVTVPNYAYRSDTLNGGAWFQNSFRDLSVNFTPDPTNGDLAAVTNDFFNFNNANGYIVHSLNDVSLGNALRNGDSPENLYNLYRNIGYRNNQYTQFDENSYRFTVTGSADLGNHALQAGFEYQQITDRQFNLNPVSLWTLARQYTNSHLKNIDFNATPTISYYAGQAYYSYPRLVGGDQTTFDRNLRTSLGLDPNGTDLINIDALNPDQMSINMFSADELLNQGNNLVSYYGYDYKGNKLTSKPSFEDFFQKQDAAGNHTRLIPAFQPNYIAGYVMDKFAFDDIIFNVGVRVDRYDANQYVLKDPYIVGEGYTVASDPLLKNADGSSLAPGSIGSNYSVYVNDLQNPTAVVGYRDGDQWYNAQGIPISDPSVLRTATGIAPHLVDPNAVGENLTAAAFKQYKPQVNVMPRVAFSFPISDQAVFFAHYDILTQRPTSNNRLDPINYLYLTTQANNSNFGINNPALKPTRTVDYELGFQQVLTKSSSLKISAFYRDLRDMISAKSLTEAYPTTYVTYSNFDFGTVKGISLTYDLRRTGNVTLRVSYTLQFANATGSNADSGINLANSGEPQLRVISPTDQDQRHVLLATLDYRYGDGADYNGPIIGGKKIFANAGVNFTANLGSGTPYSKQLLATATQNITGGGSPQLNGTINGSRLPWQFRLDMSVDKSFKVKINGGKSDKKGKTLDMNVYLLVNNLLNSQNILSVYRFTGNPTDDGYLAAAQFQPQIRAEVDPTSYRQLYSLKVNDPRNYGIARTVQLGLKVNF